MSTGEDGAPPWAQSSSMGPMMRKRHEKSGRAAVGNGSTNAVTSVSGVLSRFDVYARIDDDLAVKTQAGAAVTIGFWVFMVVLCIGEIQAYRKLRPPTERVVVDSSLGQRLRININITFHSIPCLECHVDAMDVAGENHIDIDHGMWKQRLGPDGSPVGEAFSEVPGEGDGDLDLPEDYCGSCFGAREGCCQTCKEVTDAYTAKGWTVHDIRRTAEQCIRDNHMETPIVPGEGCNLSGYMSVNKVSGNFHVAAGDGVMREGRHIHVYTMEQAQEFNTSHTITQLSFGEPYPGMKPNPLDSTSRIIDEDKGTGAFEYFMKLVPTVHALGPRVEEGVEVEGEQLGSLTSQFAYTYKFRSLKGATEYHTELQDGEEKNRENGGKRAAAMNSVLLPGVFFVYDVSPFMVEVIPADETPLSHLLLRLCAVAGGAFAVAGIVDSTVFYVSNRLRRHGLLG